MNSPFDTRIMNPLEKPVSGDPDLGESQILQTIRYLLWQQLIGRTANANPAALLSTYAGFYGAGFQVQPVIGALEVTVNPGLGFFYNPSDEPTGIGGVTGLNDVAALKPIVLQNALTITGIPPAPSGSNARYDIVEVDYTRYLTDATAVLQLNETSGVFAPATLQKTMSFDADTLFGVVPAASNSTAPISYKYGVAGLSPTVPTVSTGPLNSYTKIAEIYVGSGVTSFVPTGTNGNIGVINDLRKILLPYNQGDIAFDVTIPSSGTATPVINSVIAPPGVTVVAFGGTPSVPTSTGSTSAQVTVLIFGGDLTNALYSGGTPTIQSFPICLVSSPNANGGGNPLFATTVLTEGYTGSVPTGGVTSAIQTALGTANVPSSFTAVALNQPCITVALSVNATASGNVTYHGLLKFRGG